ncbi:hypothetical protein D3C72_1412650 [compost metagenome]
MSSSRNSAPLRKSTGHSASSSPSLSSPFRSSTWVPWPENWKTTTSPGLQSFRSRRRPYSMAAWLALPSSNSVGSNPRPASAWLQRRASFTQPPSWSAASGYASIPTQSARRRPPFSADATAGWMAWESGQGTEDGSCGGSCGWSCGGIRGSAAYRRIGAGQSISSCQERWAVETSRGSGKSTMGSASPNAST